MRSYGSLPEERSAQDIAIGLDAEISDALSAVESRPVVWNLLPAYCVSCYRYQCLAALLSPVHLLDALE